MMIPALSIALLSLLTAPAAATPCIKTCIAPKNRTVIGGDDSPGITQTINDCGANSRVVFQEGVTYNLFTPWKFTNLSNIELVFLGNLTLSDNITYVQSVVNNAKIFPGQWIQIRGANVTFTGNPKPDGGWFIGHGENWWAEDNQTNRPKFFGLYADNMILTNMKVLNPIAWCFGASGNGLVMKDTLIDARSTNGFPFNTDGIDLSASNALIDNITIYNGDDGIVISPPAFNVTVRNVQAHGTHGLSVTCTTGTGGNYTFENADVYNSLIGCRFKGKIGATCNLTDVHWRDVRVHNVSFPIHFIENYWDPENGTPPPANTSTAATAINWSWERISGTVATAIGDGSCVTDPCWYYTTGQSPEKGLYLLCRDKEHCQDFHFSDINIQTAEGQPAEEECTGLEGVTGMGITCTNGTITPD